MKIIVVKKMTQLLGLRENGKELQFKAFEFAELFERQKRTKKNGLLLASCFFLILFVREMRAAKELESKQK